MGNNQIPILVIPQRKQDVLNRTIEKYSMVSSGFYTQELRGRDLPEYYGPWQTVYKRFSQWQKDDKLRKLFENVRSHPDMQDLCIDGTYIKAHRASAGAKKGLREMITISILESAGEDAPPKSMP